MTDGEKIRIIRRIGEDRAREISESIINVMRDAKGITYLEAETLLWFTAERLKRVVTLNGELKNTPDSTTEAVPEAR